MVCKIYLRRKQAIEDRWKYLSDKVTVFAPSWVHKGLTLLGMKLQNTIFEVYDNDGSTERKDDKFVETILITPDFNGGSLTVLQKIARNESRNTDGRINAELYPNVDFSVVISLQDLVRQCVVVGIDETKCFGGYGCPKEAQCLQRVYLVDLAALQFQQAYNTGRLVLLEEDSPPAGLLDEFIYNNVVGEKKRTFEEVHATLCSFPTLDSLDYYNKTKRRYISHSYYEGRKLKQRYFDRYAYTCFIKKDIVLSGLSITEQAHNNYPKDQVVFKFLKYGTGTYAGNFSSVLDKLILPAVLSGIQELLKEKRVKDVIRCVELPFYKMDENSASIIKNLQETHNISVIISSDDALKKTHKEYLVATTNCGDNHAAFGNSMDYTSVDAAIAENLESKGNIFSPIMNTSMAEQFLVFK